MAGIRPSLSLCHVDTKPPAYMESTYVPKDEIIYHEWENAFFIKCLGPVLEAVVRRSLHRTTRVCCGLTLSRATSMHPGRSRTPLQLPASSSCDVL
ncbi:hypothetical protein B0H11DRAFT_2220164 [Mycena galericulata]|nr:hypothetical protein B0H11DRAFT_2220164 [Mycena galericulata]